jgi:hypothetical protein
VNLRDAFSKEVDWKASNGWTCGGFCEKGHGFPLQVAEL